MASETKNIVFPVGGTAKSNFSTQTKNLIKSATSFYDELRLEFTDIMDRFDQATSMKQLQDVSKELSEALAKKIKAEADDEITKAFQGGLRSVASALGFTPSFDNIDKKALDAILNEGVLFDAYTGIQQNLVKDINEIITESIRTPRKFSIDMITNSLQQTVNKHRWELRRIARSETTIAANTGKSTAYRKADPEGNKTYKWRVLPFNKKRSSPICQEIKAEVDKHGGSLPIDELRDLINKISIKHLGPTWKSRDWLPHPNCRSILERSSGGI